MAELWSLVQMWDVQGDARWVGEHEQVPDCRLGLIKSGCGCWNLNGRDHFVRAGDVVVVLPQTTRVARTVEAPLNYVAVRCAWPAARKDAGSTAPQLDPMRLPGRVYAGLEEIDYLTRLLRRARAEKELAGPYVATMVDTLMRQFFVRLCRIADAQARAQDASGALGSRPSSGLEGHPPALVRALEHIHNRLDRQIAIEEIAGVAGYSVAQLRRLFHAHLGTPPSEYIIEARMRRAMDLLRATSLRVHEVADSVGYADPLHFSRRFKAMTGLTPSGYANTYRNAPTTL